MACAAKMLHDYVFVRSFTLVERFSSKRKNLLMAWSELKGADIFSVWGLAFIERFSGKRKSLECLVMACAGQMYY